MRYVLSVLVLVTAFGFSEAQRPQRPNRPQGNQASRPSLHPLLDKAIMGQKSLRFAGTRKVMTRLGPENRENTERVWQDGSRIRIEFAEGSSDFGQIIVVAQGKRQHYFPGREEIHVRPARFDEPLLRLGDVMRGGGRRAGAVKESAGGSIAGQRTTQLSFQDGSGNTVAKLWIQPENGMVLKREMFDPSGRLVGSLEYTTVNLRPTFSDDDFKINRRGAKILTPDDLLRTYAQGAKIRPLRLQADGFDLDSVRSLPLGSGQGGLGLTYINPERGRVSVFLVRAGISVDRLRRMQGPNIQSVSKAQGDVTIVVMGALPAAELQRLLEQVR